MRRGLFGVTSFGSLILGILAVVFLGLLAVKLVYFFIDQDTKNAASFMNELEAKVNNLLDGQNNTFALRGVDGWILVGWNKNVSIANESESISYDKKPQECFDKNCLCLCPESISQCNLNAQCRFFDREVQVVSKINYLTKTFSGATPRLEQQWVNLDSTCIHFNSQLIALFVDKKSSQVSISVDYGNQESTYTSGNENEVLDLIDGGFNGQPSSSSNYDAENYVNFLRNRCN
jgi:hypothetical protein